MLRLNVIRLVRQVDSFEADLSIKGVAEDFPAVFIRAPHIVECR